MLHSFTPSRRTLLKAGIGSAVLAGANPRAVFGLTASPVVAPVVRDATQAAQQYLSALSNEQKKLALLDYTDERRVDWQFIPLETRKGLALRDMNESQRAVALKLLQQVLSPKGFDRAVEIMHYEAILLELEGPTAAKRRDYTKYYFSIYGEPSEQGDWGLSVEGHHLSVNFTMSGGVVVDSTPQFFGVNPAELRRTFKTPNILKERSNAEYTQGVRMLAGEEDSAFALIQSLSDEQRAKAIYSSECPDDIQWVGKPQPTPSQPVGIAAKDLNAAQQRSLSAVLASYSANVPEEIRQQRSQLIEQAGVDQIYFGWAGEPQKGKQHYYRIQGPTFIAELCNFQTDPEQNVANHIHCVWRDMTGDFNLPISGK